MNDRNKPTKPALSVIKGGAARTQTERDLLALHLQPGQSDPAKRQALRAKLLPHGKLKSVK